MLPDARPSRRTECPGPDRRVGTLPATGSPADADRRPRTVRSVGPSTPARNARRPAVPAVDPGATVGPDGVLRPSSVRPGRWTADRCGAGTHRSGADASAVGEGDDLRPTRAVVQVRRRWRSGRRGGSHGGPVPVGRYAGAGPGGTRTRTGRRAARPRPGVPPVRSATP